MKDAFLPWGAGSRSKTYHPQLKKKLENHTNDLLLREVCIGMHLARIELRKGAALFFHNFPKARLTTKEGFSDRDMDQVMFFLMSPKGHRLLIEA
jgi:hypothetical protein